jgi:hypothetical protein
VPHRVSAPSPRQTSSCFHCAAWRPRIWLRCVVSGSTRRQPSSSVRTDVLCDTVALGVEQLLKGFLQRMAHLVVLLECIAEHEVELALQLEQRRNRAFGACTTARAEGGSNQLARDLCPRGPQRRQCVRRDSLKQSVERAECGRRRRGEKRRQVCQARSSALPFGTAQDRRRREMRASSRKIANACRPYARETGGGLCTEMPGPARLVSRRSI